MLVKKIFLPLLLISFANVSLADAFQADDILGFWLSESKEGVIEIYKKDNVYEGKLVWIKDIHTGKVKDKLDINNPDESKQKSSLINLVNLKGFSYKSNEWSGGSIYDPKNGKTYKAYMKLKDLNNLKLRGYIGISLFGRTTEWTREESRVPKLYKK